MKSESQGTVWEAEQLIGNSAFQRKLPALPDIPATVINSTKTNEEMIPATS